MLVSLQQITLFGRFATARVAGINGRAAGEDLGTAPKVKVLSGERRRERVISPEQGLSRPICQRVESST